MTRDGQSRAGGRNGCHKKIGQDAEEGNKPRKKNGNSRDPVQTRAPHSSSWQRRRGWKRQWRGAGVWKKKAVGRRGKGRKKAGTGDTGDIRGVLTPDARRSELGVTRHTAVVAARDVAAAPGAWALATTKSRKEVG